MLAIRRYFYSGWAWLIPYLAAYILYAALKWPVNSGGSGRTAIPCLLHVYWVLHALHLAAGAATLLSWWRSTAINGSFPTAIRRVAPWLCLAAIFWIPGLYLEWPSDPWEHLRRINEWHTREIVTAHYYWTKSSYFLLYSLTAQAEGVVELRWLAVCHTAACLLLSWQYHRLARETGLSERASFVFVLLTALTFGNNIFSFHRYYGLSSSLFAQIGAIAITRIALEICKPTPCRPATRKVARMAGAALTIFPLIAFNHGQGFGIAALGILAAVVSRLSEWKRSTVLWTIGTAVMLSIITVRWMPRHPAIDQTYRPEGWLNVFYGFNLFAPSPALDRMLQILGISGMLTLAAGVWLMVRRAQVIGWMTLLPVLLLVFPCFALPYANILAFRSSSYDNIVAFHRSLLAVPIGLALVAAFSDIRLITKNSFFRVRYRPLASGFLPLCLAAALILPPNAGSYNSLWQRLQITPNDLELGHFTATWEAIRSAASLNDDDPIITPPLGAAVRETLFPTKWSGFVRKIYSPMELNEIKRLLRDIFRLPRLPHEVPTGSPHEHTLPDHVIASFPPPRSALRPPQTLTTADVSWLALGGSSPNSIEQPDGSIIVENPIGAATHAFTAPFIAIEHDKRYRLTCTVQQSGSLNSSNYLAVAWYNQDKELLEANLAQPQGADSPDGWTNGTYSYYGLVNQPAPTSWTTYTISFGSGERFSIPANAAFMRLGALLNYEASSVTKVQLKDLILQEAPNPDHVLVSFPDPLRQFSAYSLAAQLSGHWPSQKVAVEHGGLPELRTAITARLAEGQ